MMLQLENDSTEQIESYLSRLRLALGDLPADDRDAFIARIRAEIEIDVDLDRTGATEQETVDAAIARHGDPDACASRLRAQVAPAAEGSNTAAESESLLRPCRACKHDISTDAVMCPKCGAPFPARTTANVSGYEWKSKATLFGWPLVHVAFGRDKNGKLRVAKGIVAIGQFGVGAVTVAQFGGRGSVWPGAVRSRACRGRSVRRRADRHRAVRLRRAAWCGDGCNGHLPRIPDDRGASVNVIACTANR